MRVSSLVVGLAVACACLVILVGCFPRVVFPLVVARPEMLCIMAGLDQNDRYAARCLAHRRFLQWHVQDWY